MTFQYVYFPTTADGTSFSAKYWAQVEPYIKFCNNTTVTDANRYRLTFSWYEFSGSSRIRHEKVDTYSVPSGTQTTGDTYTSLVNSDFGDPNKVISVAGYYPQFKFEWMRNSTVLETNTMEFRIYGKEGAVNWNYDVPKPYSTQYPLINQSFGVVTQLIDYNSTSSGAPFVWRGPYLGIPANGWGQGMIEYDGYGYVFENATTYLTAPTTRFEIGADSSLKIAAFFYAYLNADGIKKSGRYRLGVRCIYQNLNAPTGSYDYKYNWSDYFTVYDPFAGAALHIASVVPSKYQEGSSDPLRGMPPFTVTVADDTVRGTYTIPLESITIEWDDPQSESDSWTITNPGTSAISIPPHVYTDSKTHNIQMICKDKLGNVTTAEVKFSPSQEPRIISRPTLNGYNPTVFIGRLYPALMQGQAYNAGSPMPETTWTYTLQSDPGYYSGSKVGEYVEFSLLAQGTYNVTATIRNGNIVLGTYSWTVDVGAEPVSSAADKQMPEYALLVLDSTWEPVDRCKQHSCPQYTENFQDLDTVSFELPADYQYADLLKEGNYFLFGMGGIARPMMVSYRQKKDNVLTISAESVFPKRIAIYATRSTASDGYDVQKCSAEALIRYFAHTATTDPYNSQPRGADFWMHGTNQNLPAGGAQVTYSARYDNILDIVNSVCKTAGIGYSMGVRNDMFPHKQVQMTIKESVNRTYSSGGSGAVIFSEKLKNCIIESEQSAVSSNVAISAGAGVGYVRQYSYYDLNGAPNPSTTGFNRQEVFVDAGDSADSSEQKRMAMYELREEQALTISLQVLPTCQWKYGTDYNVGDTVSVWLESRGGLVDLQIYSADHVLRESGEELHLHLGSRAQTAPALIAANTRQNTYARK